MKFIVSIGSNIKPAKHVPWVIEKMMRGGFNKLVVSPFFRTQALGMVSNGSFWNGAVSFESELNEFELKACLNSWEEQRGRNRQHPHSSVRDRALDLDIIWSESKGWFEPVYLLRQYPYVWQPVSALNKVRYYGVKQRKVWFCVKNMLFGGRRVDTSDLEGGLTQAHKVLLGVGSNIEPEQHLKDAAKSLRDMFSSVHFSLVYESAAVGMDGDDFLNACCLLESHLPQAELLLWLKNLEDKHGRDRSSGSWKPRTLDLDILMVDGAVMDDDFYKYGHVYLPAAELVNCKVIDKQTFAHVTQTNITL